MHRQSISRQNNERHIEYVLFRHRLDIIVATTTDTEWISWLAKFCFKAALFVCADWSRRFSFGLSRWRWPKWTGHENRFLVFHASSKYKEEDFTWTSNMSAMPTLMIFRTFFDYCCISWKIFFSLTVVWSYQNIWLFWLHSWHLCSCSIVYICRFSYPLRFAGIPPPW